MVQNLKSVLLFDYDSLFHSLNERAPGTGDWLGARASSWLAAIESGDIVRTSDVNGRGRRLLDSKRGYANPKVLGKNRGWLTASGVEIVDCATVPGLSRTAADVNLVLDAIDAAESDPDEIILLTADTDLTPILYRLRTLNQRVVVYATDAIATSYRTLADGVIDESDLIDVLSRPGESYAADDAIPKPPRMTAPPIKAASRRSGSKSLAVRGRHSIDREVLATLVRRIHQATNVPLFSPRAFADLFRLIAEDIKANGYKFQTTTENVTAAMNRLGRSVTKRQVGFIIKGLALRGHVFGGDDSPQDLASVFYEQVLYLVEGSDLDLSPDEQGLVSAWIGGVQGPAVASRKPADAERRQSAEADEARGRAARQQSDETRRPRHEEAPARSERTAAKPAPRPQAEAEPPRRPARAATAAQPARPDPRRQRPAPAQNRDAELEDSILSAIADAVDVLADDRPINAPPQRPRRRVAEMEAPTVSDTKPPRMDRAKDKDGSPGDEIGEEIQRILASYTANR
jgi:hypothetical protein